jgi:hypothetical protein
MAVAMGLHRESVVNTQAHTVAESAIQQGSADFPRSEVRRRTFWSLVNADILAGLLSGRPRAFGWDPLTMDVKIPSNDRSHVTNPSNPINHDDGHKDGDISDAAWTATAFALQAEFATILSRIQNRMAQLTQLTVQEVIIYHEELQAWMRSHRLKVNLAASCPEQVRLNAEWQQLCCLSACVILSQPHLLHLALDRQGHRAMTAEDWQVIFICQDTACNIIAVISATRGFDRAKVWHSSVYLFQACLILLLSIALGPELSSAPAQVYGWKQNLETARQSFKQMAPLTRRSDRFGKVFESLYDAVIAAADAHQQSAARDGFHLPDRLAEAALSASIVAEDTLETPTTNFVYDEFSYGFEFDLDFALDYPAFGDVDFYQPRSDHSTPDWQR